MHKALLLSLLCFSIIVSAQENRAAGASAEEIAETVRTVVERTEAPAPAPQAPAPASEAAPAPQPAQPAASAPEKGKPQVSFASDGQDIEALVDVIRKTAEVNIVLDKPTLDAAYAAGTARRTITLKVDNMSLRSALNWICRLSGLAWTLKDEAIFISTPDKIKSGRSVLRVYDIRDMAATIEDFPGPHIELVAGEADVSFSN